MFLWNQEIVSGIIQMLSVIRNSFKFHAMTQRATSLLVSGDSFYLKVFCATLIWKLSNTYLYSASQIDIGMFCGIYPTDRSLNKNDSVCICLFRRNVHWLVWTIALHVIFYIKWDEISNPSWILFNFSFGIACWHLYQRLAMSNNW